MRTRRAISGLVLVAASATLVACGSSSGSSSRSSGAATADVSPAGDIPDSQVFVPYRPANGAFTVSVPEGWARTDLANGAEFTDKFNTVRIEESAAPDPISVASVQATDVPTLRQNQPSFQLGAVNAVTPAGAPAIRTTYAVDGTPDATTGKTVRLGAQRYQYWKSGLLATVTLSGAKGADNVDPWRTISDSFRWAS